MTFEDMWRSLEEKDTTGKYKQAREMAELNMEQLEFAYNSGYAQGYSDGYLRGKGEITNDDIQQAIKEGFANGYEMAKEKIIHSIAKQYSEHNELVPIWLSIGDIKGGAE